MTDQPTTGSNAPEPDPKPEAWPGAPSPTPPPPPLAPLVNQGSDAPPAAGWAPADQGDGAPAPAAPPVAPPKPPSRLRTFLIFGVIVVFIGVVLYVVRNNVSADDLVVGQCFDVPSRSEDISTVEKHECTEAHDAEVFHVAEMTGDSYPITLTFRNFVDTSCIPAFATYVGRTFEAAEELDVGFFYPNSEGWDGGDRTVTCYIVRVDEAQMTQSVKAGS
jgi:hypothetical protein